MIATALGGELSEHLGYPPGQAPPGGAANVRNGSTPKTLKTELGEVPIKTPRDRAGTFEPSLVKSASPAGGRRRAHPGRLRRRRSGRGHRARPLGPLRRRAQARHYLPGHRRGRGGRRGLADQAAGGGLSDRGHFRDDPAATKLIYLAIERAETKWRTAYNWTNALRALKIDFRYRIPD